MNLSLTQVFYNVQEDAVSLFRNGLDIKSVLLQNISNSNNNTTNITSITILKYVITVSLNHSDLQQDQHFNHNSNNKNSVTYCILTLPNPWLWHLPVNERVTVLAFLSTDTL